MPKSKLVALLYAAWDDADRVYAGLSDADALKRHEGGSTFAWTLAHITRGLDGWCNVTLQGGKPNEALEAERLRNLPVGDAHDFAAIKRGVSEVRTGVKAYLDNVTDADLERITVPPFGRWHEAKLRYHVYRAVAHTYFHIGEVAAKRDRLGHKVGDYPGPLTDAM